MKPAFRSTSLLDHPTVRAAFDCVASAGIDDSTRAAMIALGEMISRESVCPDPDAVAGIIAVFPQAQRPNPKIGKRAQTMGTTVLNEAFHQTQPFTNEGERQIFFAWMIRRMNDWHDIIVEQDNPWDYHRISNQVSLYGETFRKAIENTAEIPLARKAAEAFYRVSKALADEVASARQKYAFENSGFPNHPDIRCAYDFVLNAELKNRPRGERVEHCFARARLLLNADILYDAALITAAIMNSEAVNANIPVSTKAYELYAACLLATSDRPKQKHEQEGILLYDATMTATLQLARPNLAKFRRVPGLSFSKMLANAIDWQAYCAEKGLRSALSDLRDETIIKSQEHEKRIIARMRGDMDP